MIIKALRNVKIFVNNKLLQIKKNCEIPNSKLEISEDLMKKLVESGNFEKITKKIRKNLKEPQNEL